MTIKEELYDILCTQQGIKPEALKRCGIEGYFREGWMGEEDLIVAIKTILKRRRKK